MTLETSRLILRPWRESDAENLYKYAKDPRVGPIAGWSVHTSVENSREIILSVFTAEETYAVTIKGDDTAIGSVGLMIGENSNLNLPGSEGEIGYWIAVPFWGHGYIPEAAQELIRHGFDDFNLESIWCGYFDGNENSKRVCQKCGFKYVRTEEKYWPLIDEKKTQHIACLTKKEWYAKNILIRKETPADYEEIYKLVKSSFATTSYSDGTEADYLNEIRTKDTFIPELSQVAETQDGKLVGQIVLYRTLIQTEFGAARTLVLSPISVHPDYFRRGIARAMVNRASQLATDMGFTSVFLCGDPVVYQKLGFVPSYTLNIFHKDDPNAEWCLGRELVPDVLANTSGTISIV